MLELLRTSIERVLVLVVGESMAIDVLWGISQWLLDHYWTHLPHSLVKDQSIELNEIIRYKTMSWQGNGT